MKTVISTLALALVLTASTAALAQDYAWDSLKGSAAQQMMEDPHNMNIRS